MFSQFPDGENYRDVFGRLESLLLEMVAEPQPVVVVAHLAVLRVIYGWASIFSYSKISYSQSG